MFHKIKMFHGIKMPYLAARWRINRRLLACARSFCIPGWRIQVDQIGWFGIHIYYIGFIKFGWSTNFETDKSPGWLNG